MERLCEDGEEEVLTVKRWERCCFEGEGRAS